MEIDESNFEYYVNPKKLKEVSVEVFIEELLGKHFFVRKLIRPSWAISNCYSWDSNFEWEEILEKACVQKIKTKFFRTYEMPWKKIIVVYTDSNGYTSSIGIETFNNKEDYQKAVSFND